MNIERLQQEFESSAPAPLHAKLSDALLAQISDGTLQPGDTLPSERQLQSLLDLSRPTIRQAINALIRKGLVQRVAGKGTFVLEPEKPKTPTGLVGLIVSRPNFHFFYPQLAASFAEQIRTSNYGLVMALHGDRADLLGEAIEGLLLTQHIVGLAITPPRFGSVSPVVRRLNRANVPFVFIGRQDADLMVDSVAPDNVQIGYQATRHLLELGHQRIAHFGFSDYVTGRSRLEGYQLAMAEAELPAQFVEIPEHITTSGEGIDDEAPGTRIASPAREMALQVLAEPNRPTAVFGFNDVVAMGVYKAARELNLRLPRDLSLISVDNLPTITHFEVPLTTFALPGAEIGRRGANLLLRRIAGDEMGPQQYLLSAPMIQRDSTAVVPQKEMT
ncbi:MAG: GntR family transcriptional regulator [Anaerolineales bacterium]|nr:GntR family transcriptional regulator [Anaerolineales bacterium]